MAVKIQVELKPFRVPNFVLKVCPRGFVSNVSIKDLDGLVLDQLCKDFRTAVFEKAGIEDKCK